MTRMYFFHSVKVLDRAHFLPQIGSGAETRTQYQQLCQALDEYTRKTFYEWTQTVDKVTLHIFLSHADQWLQNMPDMPDKFD